MPLKPLDFERATVLRLLQLLKARSDSDRLDAVRQLGCRGIRSAWRPVQSLLSDPYWVVRCEAADTLRLIEATKAIPQLRRALKSKNAALKGYVSRTLATLGDKTSRPVFESMRKSRSERMRLHGAAAVYVLGDRQRLPEIIKVLTSTDYRNQCAAANVLEAIVTPGDVHQAVAGLRKAISVERNPARVADFRSAIRNLKSR